MDVAGILKGMLGTGAIEQSSVKPLILLSSDDGTVGVDDLLDAVQHFKSEDDVFSLDFLSDSIVIQSSATVHLGVEHLKNLKTSLGPWTVKSLFTLQSDADRSPLPHGPYFLCGRNLHQAWRLYPDNLDCFASTVVQSDTQSTESGFGPLVYLDTEGVWKNIAVPSRLYSQISKDKPLAGKRISIKDCYRLRGVKATLSSRPFEQTYGPESETASFIQRLIKLGAVVVEKSKMSAFLSSEEPTDQWIDFHAPFNPRGDGYQTPAECTNGGAAALAGYPWLDYSVGTDTSGSIRYPAALCGLHALRYTSRTIPMTGIWPGCRELDAIGLLGRDLQSFHEFAKSTVMAGPGDINEFPQKILYPTDFLPYGDSQMQAILVDFLAILEKFLDVKKTTFSISERWEKFPPLEGKGKSIKEYLEKVGFYPFYYDGYHEYEQFRTDHQQKFDKKPYVGPYMQWKWETGSKVTLEQKNQSIEDMKVYRKWFAGCVLDEDQKTASDAILIMPLETPAPDYRDTLHKAPGPVGSFSETYTASILGLPQLVLTSELYFYLSTGHQTAAKCNKVGQIPYDSRVSGRTEYHPVTISLVGARGSDLMLINLAKKTLESAGWSDKLLTGRNTFELGAGMRHMAENKEAYTIDYT